MHQINYSAFCYVSNFNRDYIKNLDKKVVFGDWLSIDKKNAIIDYNHAFDFNLNHFKYEGFHLSATSMFWRSEVHKRFSGFDNNLHYTMDYQTVNLASPNALSMAILLPASVCPCPGVYLYVQSGLPSPSV